MTINNLSPMAIDQLFLELSGLTPEPNLRHLPPKVLLKIALFSNAMSSLRLCSLRIANSLGQAITVAKMVPTETDRLLLKIYFPKAIKFPNLKILELDYYRFPLSRSYILKTQLPIYPELEKLNIMTMSSAQDRDLVAPTFKHLSKLRSVKLGSCQFFNNDDLLTLMTSAPQLQELELQCARFTDPDFIRFNLPKLTSLKILQSPFLTNKFLESLLRILPNLQVLEISDCSQITSQTLSKALSNELTSLEVNLSRSDDNNSEWDWSFFLDLIVRNPKLIELKIDGNFCNLTGPINQKYKLVAFSQLRILKLSSVNLDHFVFLLPEAKQLEYLKLFYCDEIRALHGKIGTFPKLQTLIWEGTGDQEADDDELLELLISKTTRLTTLKFSDCNLTDKIWEWLNLSHLRFIELGPDNGPYFESAEKMGDFFRKAPLLEEINFSFEYSPKEIESLGNLDGCLQHLKMIAFRLFSSADKIIFEMVNQACNLESLYLRCCDDITEKTAIEAIRKCPKLENLSIQLCDEVSEDDEERIDAFMLNHRGIKNKGSYEDRWPLFKVKSHF